MKNIIPKVSIITVTFDLVNNKRIKTFGQCVNSIQNQTYNNIEHIVIDGGSEDGTLKILDEYFDKGQIRYYSEKDSGIYNAMNKGIELSTGQYIAFLNSDDFYHYKRAIEDSVYLLEKEKAGFSYACARMKSPDLDRNYLNHPNVNPNIKTAFYQMPFSHQSMLTRKNIFNKIGLFNEKYKSAGDYDFVLRLCLNNISSVRLDKSIVTFRVGGFSEKYEKESKKEIIQIYMDNYKKIYPITLKEAQDIYWQKYYGITMGLAEALRISKYFNQEEYHQFLANSLSILRKLYRENNELKDELKRIYDSRSWRAAKTISQVIKTIGLK